VTTMNYAIIDLTGLVVNAIEWDGITPWTPPEGCQAVPLTEGGIGWSYIDGQFVPPPEPEEAEEDTVLIRARNEDGTYIADDPATPDVNEAYVEVPLSEA